MNTKNWGPKFGFVFFLSALIFSTSGALRADADGEKASGGGETELRSLEWQKSAFEGQLAERLRTAIGEAVSEKFIVNVNIELKAVAKKAAAPKAPGLSDADLIPLGKLNMTSQAPQAAEVQKQKGFFESIQKMGVTVLLDLSVADSRQDVIRKIVQNLTDPIVGEGEADITFEKIDLAAPVSPEHWGLLRWFVELKGLLTALLAALIVGVFGTMWVREYRSLEMKKIAVLERQYDSALPAIETTKADDHVLSASQTLALPGGDSHANSGVQKFRTLARVDRDKASTLLKQWIRANSDETQAALSALSRQLDTNEVVEFLPSLKTEERRAWKRIVDRGASRTATAEVDSFISGQVLGALLSTHSDFDAELVQKVSDLAFEDCIEIASNDATAGAVLAMLLPSSQLTSFYNHLPQDTASEIVEAAMGMTGDRAKEHSATLLKAINRLTTRQSPAPFADRVDDLLKNARPEQESAIFDLLGQSGDFTLLRETAKQFFPSELIRELPGRILKTCLGRFPSEKQAEIIFCRESERPALLEAMGATGSKVRDLIEVELNRLEKDEVRAKRVARQSADLWKEYVTTVRDYLKNNESAREQASEVLKPWLETRGGGSDVASAG